jgi:hypothetical protein
MQKARLSALFLVALVALGAFASVAAASGPPENTVLPAIQVATPKLWLTYTTTKGTWINEPTAYAYHWERCNAAGGECADIAGATEKNYKVLPPDSGHTLRARVTASNSSGESSAVSNATGMIAKGPEFIPASKTYPVKFNFSSGVADFEYASGGTLECTNMSGSGTISGPSEITAASMTLTGCRGSIWECKPMESSVLHGYFAYLNAATKTVGLELGGPGTSFASISCNGSPVPIQGRIIGQITPVNVSTSVFGLEYKIKEHGYQNPSQLEGGPLEQLEWKYAGIWERWALKGTNTLSTNSKGELVA